MEKFINLKGIAAPLKISNVDTDMIIPKQYLKTIKRTGLAKGLFAEMRFDANGAPQPDFVLNKAPFDNAKILVAGENFGCGSSREHAPWALLDFGIKCVIAPSFADIFYNNCFKNGILPIVLGVQEVKNLWEKIEAQPNAQLEVDLLAQHIVFEGGKPFYFEVDPFRKKCLLEGLDDIGLTLEFEENITSFENSFALSRPWI